jgi:hypothetical protein
MAMRVNTKRGAAALYEGEKRGRGRPKRNITPDGDVAVVAPTKQGRPGTVHLSEKPMNGRLFGNLTKYLYHRQNIEMVRSTSWFASIVAKTATHRAKSANWHATATQQEAAALDMNASQTCTMISVLGLLLLTANYSKPTSKHGQS